MADTCGDKSDTGILLSNKSDATDAGEEHTLIVSPTVTEAVPRAAHSPSWLRKCKLLGLVLLVAGALCALWWLMFGNSATPAEGEIRTQKWPAQYITANSTWVYLGNGCFWERQKAYVDIELNSFRRPGANVSALVGYAGGSPADRVCYHHRGSQSDVYSHLGHAEAVAVELRGNADEQQQQLSELARDFFGSFGGDLQRPDPMDHGSEYRNVVGIPGGVSGALYPTFAAQNSRRMVLQGGAGGESDIRGTVWVMDTADFGFFRGEQYHQFHSNFFGEGYGSSYLHDLRRLQIDLGKIPPTGCPSGVHKR